MKTFHGIFFTLVQFRTTFSTRQHCDEIGWGRRGVGVRGGPAAWPGSFNRRGEFMAWGATRFWEHTGDGGHLAWGCYLGAIGRIPGGCRPVPKGKLRFTGHWEQDVYVCVCVCLWVLGCLCCVCVCACVACVCGCVCACVAKWRGTGWDSGPGMARPAVRGGQCQGTKPGWGRALEPGLWVPRSLWRTVFTWGLTRPKWYLSSSFWRVNIKDNKAREKEGEKKRDRQTGRPWWADWLVMAGSSPVRTLIVCDFYGFERSPADNFPKSLDWNHFF